MKSYNLTGADLLEAIGGLSSAKAIINIHDENDLNATYVIKLKADKPYVGYTDKRSDKGCFTMQYIRDAIQPTTQAKPVKTLDEVIAVEPIFFLVLPTDGDVYRVKNGDFGDLVAQVGDNAGACELAADLQRYCELLRGAMPSIMTSEHKDIAAFIGADTNFQIMRSYSCGSYTYKLVHKADYQTTVLVNLPTDGYAAYAIAWLYNLFNV